LKVYNWLKNKELNRRGELAPSLHFIGLKMKRLKTLLFFLFVLNLADGALLLWGKSTGLFQEANPLMRWCLERGVGTFLSVKVFLCLAYILVSLVAKKPKYMNPVTSFLVVIYSIIVLHSLQLLIL